MQNKGKALEASPYDVKHHEPLGSAIHDSGPVFEHHGHVANREGSEAHTVSFIHPHVTVQGIERSSVSFAHSDFPPSVDKLVGEPVQSHPYCEEESITLGERRPQLSFMAESHFGDLPPRLHSLAREIHQLDEEDLITIADVTVGAASRNVYSLLPYTGANWYLPSMREAKLGEKHWGIDLSWNEGIAIHVAGRRITIRLLNLLLRGLMIVLIWFLFWNALPHYLCEPGGYLFDPAVLVLVSALVGGLICRILQVSPLLGVLWIGILWSNVPSNNYLTRGVVKPIFSVCSKVGLSVILARSGFCFSWAETKPQWKETVLLATLPFAIEGITHSFIAAKLFGFDGGYTWPFFEGMTCALIAPSIVVPGALYLQRLGYCRGVGPLSLILSASGLEAVIGIWCFNFIFGIIFFHEKLYVAIILGPVQFIVGGIIGVLTGIIFHYAVELTKREAIRLPNGNYQRNHIESTLNLACFMMVCVCSLFVFFGYTISLAGGGCVACVFFPATVAHIWSNPGKRELNRQKEHLGIRLAWTWDEVVMPILFANMGATINLKNIFSLSFFPKAMICLVCSTIARLICIFLVQLGCDFPLKYKLLVCIGYIGKSTQASIGPIASELVNKRLETATADQIPLLNQQKVYATYLEQSAALYVIFLAAVGSVGILKGGLFLLEKDEDATSDPKIRPSYTPEVAKETGEDDSPNSP